MAVKVVTDSTADLPLTVAQELGITVVPLFVHFGTEVYRDGTELGADEFYRRLVHGNILPKTSAPPSGLFTKVYRKLGAESEGVISIHISHKLSATYESALLGRQALGGDYHVEVIDSLNASMALGLLVILAAKAAQAGANLKEVTELVQQAIPQSHLIGLVDTLEYLHKGGRIGKAQAFLGTALSIKPLLTIRGGETYPIKRVRTRSRAIDELCKLARGFQPFKEMATLSSSAPEEAEMLTERLASLFPKNKIYRARFGPILGTYVGPGSLGIGFIKE